MVHTQPWKSEHLDALACIITFSSKPCKPFTSSVLVGFFSLKKCGKEKESVILSS